jgi:hypothetical protein
MAQNRMGDGGNRQAVFLIILIVSNKLQPSSHKQNVGHGAP